MNLHLRHRPPTLRRRCPHTGWAVRRSACPDGLHTWCSLCSTEVDTVLSTSNPRVRYIAVHDAAPTSETRSTR